ncbi:MAG: acetylxylan esterase [Clostridia bacterium]|nr:acetylxylan esterase [Clostridia bacterium]
MKKYDISFAPRLNGYYDTSYQETAYIRSIAKEYFEKEEKEKDDLLTVEAFQERKQRVRAKFKEIIGELPHRNAPLNFKICNEKLLDGGVTLLNVVYESLPMLYVTASLWLPENYESGEKFPAVLFASGHAQRGRAHGAYVTFARTLAKRGFVVLSVDPIGQYERIQYLNSDGTPTLGASPVCEHLHMGLPCSLAGIQLAAFFVRDLERGIDVLQSLPYVDASKICMTGNSGGGTMTSYMALLDDRLLAVAPACYTTSRAAFMDTGRNQDSEQVVPKVISEGINNDDFVSLFAPKPFLICAAAYDGSDIAGTVYTYNRAKKVYEMLGAEDKLNLHISKTTHGLFKESREGIVNFFTSLFYPEKVEQEYVEEPETPESEIRSTVSGNVLLEYADAKSVYDYYNAYFEQNRYSDCKRAELKERVIKTLNIPEPLNNRPEIKYPRVISNKIENGITTRKIWFFSVGEEDFMGKRIAVAGVLIEPKNAKKCVILVVGEDCIDDIIDENIVKGNAVFVFSARGLGAIKSLDAEGMIRPSVFGELANPEYRRNSDAQMIGMSVTALRVYDCVRAFDFIKQSYNTVAFAGRGKEAVYALMAAAITDTNAKV